MNANLKGTRIRRRERWTRAHPRIIYATATTRGPTYTVKGRVTSGRADKISGK